MAITVKHKFVSAIPDGTDTTIVRPSNWNDDHDLTGTIPVSNGGTGASTATDGLNNLLPSQTGNNGKVLATDGTNASWTTNGSGDVVGPASATANAVARFDTTTGKLIQNSGVIVDDNSNITANSVFEGFSNTAASGTQIVLTAASVPSYVITGSGGQTIKLPDATILPNGTTFAFNNNQSSGAITVNNNSNTLIVSIPSGAFTIVTLLSNSIAAGSWDTHDQAPANVSWSTNTFNYPGSITGATWNGSTVQVNRGGTGQTTASAAFNALSPLTTAGDTLYGGTSGAGTRLAIGTAGQVLTVNAGATAPQWSTPTTGTVTSVSGTGTVSGISLSGTVTSSGNLTLGGTLDLSSPPAIGGTTPAAGTFTTITGQTEVLKGTGQNFVTQSNSFTNAAWTVNNTTIATTVATTDPTGGSNAFILTEDTSTSTHRIFSTAISVVNGVTYTYSIYAKNGTRNNIQLVVGGTAFGFSSYANFNISSGALGTVGSTATATITSVGNGWYRCSITVTCIASGTDSFSIYLSDTSSETRAPTYTGTSTYVYLYGAQSEVGTTTNTYTPTTTTAIYGTPTLSFSGVAGLGLESNGALYVSPAGTGALQAQATTSSTVGGNARGANAVDWQTSRTAATAVASGGPAATLGGGQSNTVSAGSATVAGGQFNNASNFAATIAGGNSNTASGAYSAIGGGALNTTTGYYNFIGGGFTNSGTANAAVTTQSGTMNATTAVTLSGSNASIKVGQFIVGTSIANNTYVAAISGTALTLSQAASGSSTSTLSFYTPHGVVVGGGNNQATGSYSFIGGGGDAGTAANRNAASGDWSFVGGGTTNTASGIKSTVSGGSSNTASGLQSVIAGGNSNTASASISSVVGGQTNTANGAFSFVAGGTNGTTRSIIANHVFAASNIPFGAGVGFIQAGLLNLGKQTTDATATVLTCDGGAAGSTNQVILPNNSAYYYKAKAISTAQFSLATTATAGAAGTATITFAAQTVAPFVVGQTIVVAGVTPTGFNGTYTVTACTTTTVQYANATTGAQTVAGTITATSLTKAWTIEGAIMRTSGVAGTRLIGSPTTTVVASDTGTSAWTLAATADTTNGGLAITFTGAAATTIRTVCKVETSEVTY